MIEVKDLICVDQLTPSKFDVFSCQLQLFLLKRGGEEIYVGPLGHNSCQLIDYFEVMQ